MSSFSPTAHVHHCAFAHLVKLLPRSATRGSCWSWAPRSLATDIVSHASSSAELGGELGVALPELTLDGVDGAESTVLGRMSTGTRGTRSAVAELHQDGSFGYMTSRPSCDMLL